MIENEYEACFFCGEKADSDATAEVAMYTDVHQGGVPLLVVRTTWTRCKAKVPRCRACKKNHNRIAWWRGGLGALGTAVGIVVAVFISSVGAVPIISIAVWILVTILGVAIGNAIGKHFVTYQMRPEGEKVQYPAIQELMKQGWSVGKGPGHQSQYWGSGS